ncbi:MAG: septum formation inhibitor Maf [Algicola sp.]|nr:septum formation inhibitor Maf [Algicola sp.]
MKLLFFKLKTVFLASTFVFATSCKQEKRATEDTVETTKLETEKLLPRNPLSNNFKKYWYAGDAEITSYQLEQARYGELRKGTAVLIYVTEPFLPNKQVKADNTDPENISVLKLNSTKKFLTGIYPYSIMNSIFYPVYDNQHALKTSLSVQEWCGHVYAQLNNRNRFEFTSHSYFESEADQALSLVKSNLENEIWTKIRINPNNLPIGDITMIPSFEFLRLAHKKVQAYNAKASLSSKEGISTYTIEYPELERKLHINFTSEFPFTIESWTEEFKSGFGPSAKLMTSSATKIKTLKTAYWGQNSNNDLILRDSLGL